MNINLIRHDGGEFDLCAQLPEYCYHINMNDLAAPLLDEIGGRRGLGYTAWFSWQHYERVKAYFESLGHVTTFVDERERDRRMAEYLRQAPD